MRYILPSAILFGILFADINNSSLYRDIPARNFYAFAFSHDDQTTEDGVTV